jgi:hypothetical protein
MMDARLDEQQNNVKQRSSRLQLPPMQRNSRHVPVQKMLMAVEVAEQQILKEVAPGEVEAQLADEPSLDKSKIGDRGSGTRQGRAERGLRRDGDSDDG